jgi:hypothetical protein
MVKAKQDFQIILPASAGYTSIAQPASQPPYLNLRNKFSLKLLNKSYYSSPSNVIY